MEHCIEDEAGRDIWIIANDAVAIDSIEVVSGKALAAVSFVDKIRL